MSFHTAKLHLSFALQAAKERQDLVQESLVAGMLALTEALESELTALKSKVGDIDSSIRSLPQ